MYQHSREHSRIIEHAQGANRVKHNWKSLVARRATYVVDGRFFAHYFWKVEGTVRIHVNSRVVHVWLPYTVINMQDGGGGFQTSSNSESPENFKFL